jgi:tetratricopeptide (TPR) repeat protein
MKVSSIRLVRPRPPASAPSAPLALLLAALLGLAACSREEPPAAGPTEPAGAVQVPGESTAGPGREAIAANNRGVGLMGRFDYEPARAVFADLVERYPDWNEVRVNLAIATLNRQQEGDEQAALAMVDEVIAQDPDDLRAHYVAGLLRLYLASPSEAIGHFRKVAEADPDDAYAAYYLGQCLAQQSEYEQALTWYQRALAADPYLRSGYYGAFQALRRLRRVDEARQMVDDYRRLEGNPRARLAEFKYTRMGPRGEALAVDAPGAPVPAPPQGPVFAAAVPLEGVGDLAVSVGAADITAVDLQGDGHLDLFIAGARADGGNRVLLGGEGGWSVDPAHPLAAVTDVNAALWGDYDNDGRVDAYLVRRGPNALWRQGADGTWQDVTAASGTAGDAEADTRGGAFFDADHDGDLDLFLVNANGRDDLLNNNLDGSFRPLAAERHIAGEGASRQVVVADLDRDRDADLLVVHDTPPHAVYLNDRLWDYRQAPSFDALREAPVSAAVAGDVDADGHPEVYTLAPDGALHRWQADAEGAWRGESLGDLGAMDAARARLGLLDVDGDGTLELLASTPQGWSALEAEPGLPEVFAAEAELAGWAPVLDEPGSGPSVVGLSADGGLLRWAPGPGRQPFLALSLTGMEDAGKSMRSNASGLGARLSVRVGSRWSVLDTLPAFSGPGQSLQPVAVGLGGDPRADFVAIDWSDGVFQSELALAAGEVHRIPETQRQLSSCPVLFAWDGQRYRFVTDLLGVGGIGYQVAPGEYAEPRPWENLLLPAGLLQPREGRYALKLTEPMEEVAYLDAARLVAYDLPPGWHLTVDERMQVAGPAPSGEALFYRRQVLPARVTNDRGQDVTAALREADHDAAPVGALDRRFIGRLATEHVLTLDFAEPLDEGPGRPLLVADGWVEYPYSQTAFAAWQAGAEYGAPTLEARGGDGRWATLYAQFGYPAGMPRQMTLPLEGLPAGTTALRLRTNQEIYWDRLAIAYAETPPETARTELPPSSARLARIGFPRRVHHAQHRPDYDYTHRSPFWDTRYQAGAYTRFGPVDELVGEVDDAVALIGPGEEAHLEFPAPPPPPAGWTRRLVLETHGWTKDMDLYTRDGETVGPMPSTGNPRDVPERLHARYNTRYLSGR